MLTTQNTSMDLGVLSMMLTCVIILMIIIYYMIMSNKERKEQLEELKSNRQYIKDTFKILSEHQEKQDEVISDLNKSLKKDISSIKDILNLK